MFIKRLYVKNFKSIKEANIQFTPFSIIVGANASGKSNLINVFRFIEDITTEGIDNAIALQGGIPYLANATLSKGSPIEIQFDIDISGEKWIKNSNAKNIGLKFQEINYKFVIQPNLKGAGYHIASDYVQLTFECHKLNLVSSRIKDSTPMGIKIIFVFEKKTVKSSIQSQSIISSDNNNDIDAEVLKKLQNDDMAYLFSKMVNEDKKELMLYRLAILFPPFFSENTFIRIFDFDPKELKKASSMASVSMLSENGANMASVLQNILRTKENRKKLTSILNDFLPFIENISIESNLDKSFSYKLKENYSNRSFYANFLSDGTVSVIAIIIALYFEERSNIIILEEPERNIHPKLLFNLLSSAEDVAKEKQVIITTHNPEFLRHAKIENVRLVIRDSEGYTLIKSPETSSIVQCFLKNDLGLDDLFLQDLLGEDE